VVRAVDHGVAQGDPSCPVCRAPLTKFMEALDDIAERRTELLDITDTGVNHVKVRALPRAPLANGPMSPRSHARPPRR
jgi:hypothetical protein